MDFHIRLLGTQDAAVLDRVDPDVFDEPVRAELAERYLSDPHRLLAVALDEDAVVVGMASGVVYLHPDKPLQLFINEVGVAERARRQGLARRLVQALLDHARSLGCIEAWVATEESNATARALYAALGGVEDAERAVVYVYPLVAPDPAASDGDAPWSND
jgi:ribosomal protein S18 acetylase RimI-like enzyme